MKFIISILLLVITSFAQNTVSIKCNLTESSTLHYNNWDAPDSFAGEYTTKSLEIVIANIESDNPLLVGNAGVQKLYVIGSNRDILQLLEPKGSGLVNILTYSNATNVLYYSKQYGYSDVSVSYVFAGKCQSFN